VKETFAQLEEIYNRPFFDLVCEARGVHKKHWPGREVQLCTLLSIKTGACSEDCGYCSQSAHHDTGLKPQPLMSTEDILPHAHAAKANGSTRFCMGAAWREVREGAQFDSVLEMVRGVRQLGMEACCTLGMLTADQARRLKEAGLSAYNHNLDTSREAYRSIIKTRTYDDRLRTLQNVRNAGLSMCCGGIIGMGESLEDRAELLQVLAGFDPHPESVQINTLVAVEGTPLADRGKVDALDLLRMIATTRIVMPKARVRLSAGRSFLSREAQILCLVAGANSIFYGEKLLTTANSGENEDVALFSALAARVDDRPAAS